MERRGRIPVAKFRTQEGKTRSRSRVREPDYNEQDPETDLFTLLEDNIALKEENKSLQAEIVENKKSQTTLIEENAKLRHEMESFKIRQKECEMELKDISGKLAKAISERSVLDKLRRTKINELKNSLTNQMQSKHDKLSSSIIIDSNGLKSKILKVIPALVADNDEMESLIGLDSALAVTSEAASHCITNECIERLLDEFVLLKNTLSTVELQLYEANEKISELMENQHSQEEENENLRSENNNLTRVAQLLTENMKESVETSKKMEAALIKLKERNDDLTMKTRDIIDGQRATPDGDIDNELKCAENSEKIRRDVYNQNKDHGERIVEMKSLLDTTIEKTTNDELKVLQLKMEILEEELRQAVARAVRAENELENLKCLQCSQEIEIVSPSLISQRRTPPLPPPPPPPIPAVLLYSPFHNKVKPNDGKADPISDATITATTTFNESIVSHNLRSGSSHCGKQQVETATGLDALVRELKSGKVTLRRHRRKTRTSEALQEMFQVLEISQKQNRNSKICIEINS